MSNRATDASSMEWGFEYLLLFGPPGNKLELLDGVVPCSFPFASRESAERHFHLWTQTVSRWKGVAAPPIARNDGRQKWQATVAAFDFTLYPRPISVRVPGFFQRVFPDH